MFSIHGYKFSSKTKFSEVRLRSVHVYLTHVLSCKIFGLLCCWGIYYQLPMRIETESEEKRLKAQILTESYSDPRLRGFTLASSSSPSVSFLQSRNCPSPAGFSAGCHCGTEASRSPPCLLPPAPPARLPHLQSTTCVISSFHRY